MTWVDKVKAGMNLMADGCRENTSLTNCNECPFTKYCDVLYNAAYTFHDSLAGKELPEKWDYV